jgi:hypothetical protein
VVSLRRAQEVHIGEGAGGRCSRAGSEDKSL